MGQPTVSLVREVDFSHVVVPAGLRIAALRLDLSSAEVTAFPHLPPDWHMTLELEGSAIAHVRANAQHGAAFLPHASDLDRLLAASSGDWSQVKIKGTLFVTTDGDDLRPIPLDESNVSFPAAPKVSSRDTFYRLLAPSALDAVRHPARVEFGPLIVDSPASAKAQTIVFSEGKFADLGCTDAEFLLSRLLATSSYSGVDLKDCEPDYHLRVRFHGAGQVVDVDFCFGCNTLRFCSAGRELGRADFDPVAPELFALFSRLLPNEPTLKQLADRQTAWQRQHPPAPASAPDHSAPSSPTGRARP